MSRMCRVVEARLVALDVDRTLGGPMGRHAASCLRCQASAVRTRAVPRALVSLEGQIVPVPPGFLRSVMFAVREVPQQPGEQRRQSRPRAGTMAAAAGATVVAAAAGAVVVFGLRRSRAA